jgi:hypothetical protein
MVALATGSFVSLEALCARRAPRAAAWLGYVACTALAVYAGFVAVLIIPAQVLVLIGRPRPPLARIGSALSVAVLCWIPLVVLAASRGSGQLFWVPRPSLTADGQVLESLTSASLAPSFHATATTLALLCLTAAILAALAWTRPRRTALLFSWLAVPVVFAWFESIVGQPVFMARNLLTALPAVAILLAVAACDRRLPRAAPWALLAALVVLRALQVTAAYGTSPEDWKSASAYVLARSAPGDCIAFYPSDAQMAFAYYVPSVARAPRSILPATAWTRPPQPYVEDYASLSRRQLSRLPSECPRLWLVSSHQGQPDGPAGARANLTRFRRLRAAVQSRYAPGPLVRTFGYAATITVELLSAPRAAQPARTQGRSVVPTKVR